MEGEVARTEVQRRDEGQRGMKKEEYAHTSADTKARLGTSADGQTGHQCRLPDWAPVPMQRTDWEPVPMKRSDWAPVPMARLVTCADANARLGIIIRSDSYSGADQ